MSYAVFARTSEGERVRVSDADSWATTQTEWNHLDGLRRKNRFPHVRHFEVRSMDDPGYKDSPVSFKHGTPLLKGVRGLKHPVDAAKRAWKLWQGNVTPYGATQGTGGWYYFHNGRTAAQGENSLLKLVQRRGLIVQGVDGKWYPTVSEL